MKHEMKLYCRSIRFGSYRCSTADAVIVDRGKFIFDFVFVTKEKVPDRVQFNLSLEHVEELFYHISSKFCIIFMIVNSHCAATVRRTLCMPDIFTKDLPYFDPTCEAEDRRFLTLVPDQEQSTIEDMKAFINHCQRNCQKSKIIELDAPSAENFLVNTIPVNVRMKCDETRDSINDGTSYGNVSAVSSGQLNVKPPLLVYPDKGDRSCGGPVSVSECDVETLAEGEFLNDVIIDFYLRYLLCEKYPHMPDRAYVFSSFFWSKLTSSDYRQETKLKTVNDSVDPESTPVPSKRRKIFLRHDLVKGWTKNIDIFGFDYLLIPINERSHWYMLIVCYPGLSGEGKPLPRGSSSLETIVIEPCILVLDSLTSSSSHGTAVDVLRGYLTAEWQRRKGTSERQFDNRSLPVIVPRLLKQDNYVDCGIFMLQYAEQFLQTPVTGSNAKFLEDWFPIEAIFTKRESIRQLIANLSQNQRTN